MLSRFTAQKAAAIVVAGTLLFAVCGQALSSGGNLSIRKLSQQKLSGNVITIGTPVNLGNGAQNTLGQSTVTMTTIASSPGGATIPVCIGSDHNPGSSGVVTGVVDSQGNSYSLANGSPAAAKATTAQADVEIWLCPNCGPLPSGATITATVATATQSGRSIVITAASITGVRPSPLDRSNNSTGSGTSPTVSTGSISQVNAIFFACDFTLSTVSDYTPSSSDAFSALSGLVNSAFDALVMTFRLNTAGTAGATNNPAWTGNGGTQVPQAIIALNGY